MKFLKKVNGVVELVTPIKKLARECDIAIYYSENYEEDRNNGKDTLEIYSHKSKYVDDCITYTVDFNYVLMNNFKVEFLCVYQMELDKYPRELKTIGDIRKLFKSIDELYKNEETQNAS